MNVVSCSFGKDSTAMVLTMLEKGEPIDKLVFYDTLMEFPQMYEHIQKVLEYTKLKCEFIYPERHFLYMMTEMPVRNFTYKDKHAEEWRAIRDDDFRGTRYGYGWPTMLRRWCTTEKNKMLNRWKKQQGEDVTFFVGIAADEDRPKATGKRYPLVEAGLTEADALSICYKHGFDFGGLYNHFRRVSCWCCPLGGKRRAKILWEYYPELWQKIKDIQTTLFHDWGDHENFLEGCEYKELELEFAEYGQIKLFN